MRRLTEQELNDLDQWAACDLDRKTGGEVCALIDELRSRRAADLTAEEVEALEFAKDCVHVSHRHAEDEADEGCSPSREWTDRALAALLKILGAM